MTCEPKTYRMRADLVWVDALNAVRLVPLLDYGERQARQNGWPVHPHLRVLLDDLAELAAEYLATVTGHVVAAATTDVRHSDQLLDTASVAGVLGIPVRSVRRLADQNVLAGRKVGRGWLFEPETVDAYRHRRPRH